MNYLDYINSIPMYQEGGSTPNPGVELLKDITPGLGTYRAYQRAKEDPRFGTYADVGLSAVGDVATLFGVGAGIKALSAANKARKAYKAADAANQMYDAYKSVRNFKNAEQAAEAAKIKRGNQAIESLSLMERTPKVESEIIKRIKGRDVARQNLRNAKSVADDAATQMRHNSYARNNNLNQARHYSDVVDASKLGALSGIGIDAGLNVVNMGNTDRYLQPME